MADNIRDRATLRVVSRRSFLRYGLALSSLGVTGLLAACGGGESTPSTKSTEGSSGSQGATSTTVPSSATAAGGAATSPTAVSGSAPDQSRMGGTGKVALYSEPPTLDCTWTTAIIVLVPAQHVFEFLFAYDSKWDVKPMLADKFDVSGDGLTYTIKLRSDVKFHNGNAMTAADVVGSLDRWGTVSGQGKEAYDSITEVTATDDSIVTITLSSPFSPLINYLSGPAGAGAIVIPKDLAEKAGTDRLPEYVGTGPYKFIEQVPDRHIKLTRFADYSARTEPPDAYAGRRTAYFDDLLFIPVPDAASRIAGVEAGDYHWAEEITRDEYARLKDSPDVDTIVIKPLRFKGIIFNKKQGIMQNPKLRQAVLYALDCEEIMAAAFGPQDFWRLEPSLLPPESVWYSDAGKDLYNVHNLEKAQALVKESGYNGEKIRWMGPADRQDYFAVAVTGVQQLKKIGLQAEVASMDWGALVKQRTQPDAYEIFNTGFSFSPEPTTLSFIPENWPGWWVSDQKTKLLDEIFKETDFQKRKVLWDQFQQLVYDEVPVIKAGDFFGLSIKSKKLKGEQIPISSFPIFWNQWLEK